MKPSATRFTTSFLTLSNLLEKEKLIAIFNSPQYVNMKFVRDGRRKVNVANAVVKSKSFSNSMKFCLKIFSPIFRLLHMVASNTYPSMGFIVGELLVVKREIMVVSKNIEKDYNLIISITENKSRNWIDSSLHLAAWFLNSLYYYVEDEMVKKN